MRIRWLLLAGLAALALSAAPAAAHEPYEHLRSQTGHECCGERDCRPIDAERLRHTSQGYELSIGGMWWRVPEDAVIPNPFRDGAVHACWRYPYYDGSMPIIRCVLVNGTV